jgi:undecaprenyl diphosphate synthase
MKKPEPPQFRDGARPRHVAIIMDGNGRWAQQRGLPRLEGHKRGAVAVRDTVRAARELGLPALTLYAFSEQNWDRPLDEVRGLMQLLCDYVIEERDEILDNGIRLRTIGNTVRLPDFVRLPLQQLIDESAANRSMVLSLALSYGGRESILEASRGVLRAVQAEHLRPDDIDEATLAAAMQTAELPPVDLIIRTSGERRVSNFLLWEGAQAKFYATTCLWPDFDRAALYEALQLAFVETGVGCNG